MKILSLNTHWDSNPCPGCINSASKGDNSRAKEIIDGTIKYASSSGWRRPMSGDTVRWPGTSQTGVVISINLLGGYRAPSYRWPRYNVATGGKVVQNVPERNLLFEGNRVTHPRKDSKVSEESKLVSFAEFVGAYEKLKKQHGWCEEADTEFSTFVSKMITEHVLAGGDRRFTGFLKEYKLSNTTPEFRKGFSEILDELGLQNTRVKKSVRISLSFDTYELSGKAHNKYEIQEEIRRHFGTLSVSAASEGFASQGFAGGDRHYSSTTTVVNVIDPFGV